MSRNHTQQRVAEQAHNGNQKGWGLLKPLLFVPSSGYIGEMELAMYAVWTDIDAPKAKAQPELLDAAYPWPLAAVLRKKAEPSGNHFGGADLSYAIRCESPRAFAKPEVLGLPELSVGSRLRNQASSDGPPSNRRSAVETRGPTFSSSPDKTRRYGALWSRQPGRAQTPHEAAVSLILARIFQ